MGFTAFIGTRFGRRLLLIAVLFVLGLAVLAAQTLRLTVIESDELRAEAESRLVRLTWSPTVRGQIRDRKGRVLAFDRPSYDVAVDYRVISGEWQRRAAARAARRRTPDWDAISREQREDLIRSMIPEFAARAGQTWQAIADETGLSITEVDSRKLAAVDELNALLETVRTRREVAELRAYAGTLGITDDELDRRSSAIDRPDLTDDADRLRFVLASEITVEVEESIRRNVREPLREETSPHVIVQAVSDEVGFRLRRLADQTDDDGVPLYPGLTVLSSHAREYPLRTVDVEIDRSRLPPPLREDRSQSIAVRGVASHLLGTVRRRVFREDLERRSDAIEQDPRLAQRVLYETPGGPRDRGAYAPGRDSVGHTGLERTLEDELRGLRGIEINRLDADISQRAPAVVGRDTTLTLDIMLQARIQALLDPGVGLASVQPWHANSERIDPDDPASPLVMPVGTPMNAAAVVIDVDTGEILALVSTPSFLPGEPARFSSELERRRNLATRNPAINRAVSTPLPPGSIAKAMVLCGAHARGFVERDERIACTGHLLPNNPDRLRCWIYKTYGSTHDIDLGHPPTPAEALKVSCNIYFYELGRRLGPEGILDLYRDYGIGEPIDLPIAGLHRGWLGRGGSGRVTPDEAILMGIGQGPVAWTPLHAADAMATLGRAGTRVQPTLIAGAYSPGTDLGYDPGILAETLRGLWLAVNDPRGTAHSISFGDAGERFDIFDAPGITVWGKTGTATAPSITLDGQVLRRGDHSWFTLLCGRDRPEYAIAVVAEYGGSGGRVSGPIANQIIYALIDEGYL